MSRRAEDQTEMTVTTPRGSRFRVTQREGATGLNTHAAYTNHALAGAAPLSGRTQWRDANQHVETPETPGHNFAKACVEARAEALVDLRAPPGLTPHQLNQRMESTQFSPVTRGDGERVATCLTCQAASSAGSKALSETTPAAAAPDFKNEDLFPPL